MMSWRRASSGFALSAAVLPASLGAACGLAGLALVGLVLQALLRLPASPQPWKLGAALLGLLPGAFEVALPVGLLLGALWVGRHWAERGQWLGLSATGQPVRRVLGPALGLALLLAGLQLGLAHQLAPRGRAQAAAVLGGGLSAFDLLPGQPLLWGEDPVLLQVEGGDASAGYQGLFLAQGDRLMLARRGHIDRDRALVLEEGQLLLTQGDAAGWTLDFDRATLALEGPTRRVELAERSSPHLADLIDRMQTHGRQAAYERLVLWKRSTVALAMPLLLILGLSLGAKIRWTGGVGAAITLCWWALTRMGDLLVGSLSPPLAALLPVLALAVVTAVAWSRWRAA